MPQVAGSPSCDATWCRAEFEETVKMATYITAFAIVDFGSIKTETSIEKTPAQSFEKISIFPLNF